MFKALIKKIFFKNTSSLNKEAADIDVQIIKIIKNLTSLNIDIVFDIGAHYGRYAKAINQQINNAEIYCFEPFPESFDILKGELNENCYHLFPLAMSDIESIQTFYVNELNETNSLLPSAVTNSEIDNLIVNKTIINVNVDTIKNFCKKEKIDHIDILKIDAQGNTINILKGATEMLQSKSIRIIQCEVEFIEIYKGQSLFHEVTSFLENFDYKLYSLYQIHYDINNRISWADALYFLK